MFAQPNANPASFRLTRNGTSSGRCQTRGGRKGGVPGRERYELLAREGAMLEIRRGKRKAEEEAAETPKQLSAQTPIDPQSAIDLSHGLARGQQSDISSPADMSSEADIAPISGDFAGNAVLPAMGSIATEIAIRSASIVRAMLMVLRAA